MSNAWGYPYVSSDKAGNGNHRSSANDNGNGDLIENVPIAICEEMYDYNSDLWSGDGFYFASVIPIHIGKYTKINALRLYLAANYMHPQLAAITCNLEGDLSPNPTPMGTGLWESSLASTGGGWLRFEVGAAIPSTANHLFVYVESYNQTIVGKQVNLGSRGNVFYSSGIGHKERGATFGGGYIPDLALTNPLYRVTPWFGLEVE